MHATVNIGEHKDVPVYGQRHAYLTNKLAGFFSNLTQLDTSIDKPDDLVLLLGDQAYDLLAIVIPTYAKRCPRYEFAGYSSQAAMDNNEYDEDADKSPTFDEILTAFEVAATANRFDVIKTLAKVVDPKLLKSWVNTQIAVAISNASANSPAPATGSETSTGSGTTAPTSTENAG